MSDGRFIDPAVGALAGEAAHQKPSPAAPGEPVALAPAAFPMHPEGPTYFDQPVLQLPVWIWTVPAYFYVGGTAGGALVLGSAAQALDGRELRGLIRRCRWIGTLGTAAGAALLTADLGRPERFLNMLRVFRPTSPMSIGSWLLAAAGPVAGAAAVFPGSRLGRPAGYAAALLGIPLAGYTGVLLGTTAVPAWQQARRSLPVLFVASAVSGAAALLDLLELNARERRVVRRFGLLGAAGELAAATAVERECRQSFGFLWKAAKAIGAAGLVVSLLWGRSRRGRIAAGALGTAAALATRFAVMEAGRRSAADPRATFRQQQKHPIERPEPCPTRVRTAGGS